MTIPSRNAGRSSIVTSPWGSNGKGLNQSAYSNSYGSPKVTAQNNAVNVYGGINVTLGNVPNGDSRAIGALIAQEIAESLSNIV